MASWCRPGRRHARPPCRHRLRVLSTADRRRHADHAREAADRRRAAQRGRDVLGRAGVRSCSRRQRPGRISAAGGRRRRRSAGRRPRRSGGRLHFARRLSLGDGPRQGFLDALRQPDEHVLALDSGLPHPHLRPRRRDPKRHRRSGHPGLRSTQARRIHDHLAVEHALVARAPAAGGVRGLRPARRRRRGARRHLAGRHSRAADCEVRAGSRQLRQPRLLPRSRRGPRPLRGEPLSRHWCGIIALAFLLACSRLAAADAPAELRADNVNEAAELLVPSIRRWVERGDLTLRRGALRYSPRWDDPFLAASEANRGRYSVDAKLNIFEAKTGLRPSYIFGLPFPAIDPGDADAGVKIMWNRWYTVYKRTQVSVPSHIHILGRGGLVRDVEALTATLAYTGREGGPLENPETTEYREIVLQTAPSYVEGVATLTWRFDDERWDSLWVYVPLARRVRQATSANRSDALAGSDVTLDDALVWAGKNQSFAWKLIDSRDVLVPTLSLDPQPLHPGQRWQNGTEWRTGED